MVKLMVTGLLLEPCTRSAAAMVKVTPVTWPPRAGYPQVPARWTVVLTLIPLGEAGMGPPIVAPLSVSVIAPAATSAVALTMYWGAVPEVVVAKPAPEAPMVPKM